MATSNERPPSANGSLSGTSVLAEDGSKNAPKAHVAQAKIDLLVDDITDTCGWLVDQLNVIPSQRAAGDHSGMIYTLRRSRCYWRHISESARELAAANDERLSGLRQESGQ
jgi:hypothetical protein